MLKIGLTLLIFDRLGDNIAMGDCFWRDADVTDQILRSSMAVQQRAMPSADA